MTKIELQILKNQIFLMHALMAIGRMLGSSDRQKIDMIVKPAIDGTMDTCGSKRRGDGVRVKSCAVAIVVMINKSATMIVRMVFAPQVEKKTATRTWRELFVFRSGN
jgi:predicted peptidase